MKNKFLELHNDFPGKSFFLHEEILNALSTAIIVSDKNDRLIYLNKMFNDIVHYKPSAHNSSMKEFVNREDWDNWNENLFKLSNLNDNNSCVFNIRFNDADEEIKCLKLEGKVLQRDENNKPLFYFFIAEDVTKQFKNQNRIQQNKSLSTGWKNFISKTSSEKKLELAVKDLNRSNKDLEEFAYTASHDLQEPLRKITTFSTALAHKFNEQLGEEGKLYLDKIHSAAGSMKELIENLLQISRTVQHLQPFSKTDLNSVVNLAKQNLDLKIEERNVEIIQQQLPVIEALPSLMLQLFNNLLSNAIKFSSKDKAPVINISSKEISDDEKEHLNLAANKTYYEIKISDNGIGFKQDCAQNIFKIFYRIHSKAEYPGTGIGLSICNKIVAKHSGCIWAESKPGNGAAFFIVLPKTHDI